MKTVIDKISLAELKHIAQSRFGELVKAVVDIQKGVMVIDGEMHADEEKELLSNGSKQENLWGINLYPDLFGKDGWIEFDSMINLRPYQNNHERGVSDPKIKKKIIDLINKRITH